MIKYVIGDATKPQDNGKPRIIAHVTNNKGGWGAGFVVAISRKWEKPENEYRKYGQTLGDVQIVSVDKDLYVANMCAQDGFVSMDRPVALSYTYLVLCLLELRVQARATAATIHMPRIGAGLGGGSWPVIEQIINECIPDVNVTIYDLPK